MGANVRTANGLSYGNGSGINSHQLNWMQNQPRKLSTPRCQPSVCHAIPGEAGDAILSASRIHWPTVAVAAVLGTAAPWLIDGTKNALVCESSVLVALTRNPLPATTYYGTALRPWLSHRAIEPQCNATSCFINACAPPFRTAHGFKHRFASYYSLYPIGSWF